MIYSSYNDYMGYVDCPLCGNDEVDCDCDLSEGHHEHTSRCNGDKCVY